MWDFSSLNRMWGINDLFNFQLLFTFFSLCGSLPCVYFLLLMLCGLRECAVYVFTVCGWYVLMCDACTSRYACKIVYLKFPIHIGHNMCIYLYRVEWHRHNFILHPWNSSNAHTFFNLLGWLLDNNACVNYLHNINQALLLFLHTFLPTHAMALQSMQFMNCDL